MLTFHQSDKIICHEGKPVAIKEKLFKILTRAHEQCQHGGRDKTSQQVRQHYSWYVTTLISLEAGRVRKIFSHSVASLGYQKS